jgi:hypothetical protein
MRGFVPPAYLTTRNRYFPMLLDADNNQQQQNDTSMPGLRQMPTGLVDKLLGNAGTAPATNGGISGPGGSVTDPNTGEVFAGPSTGVSNWAGGATPLLYAYLIGKGKMIEADNPDSPLGKGLLATLGPSIAQIKEDPKGMGLPTALGLPFLTPFTGSDKARRTAPEWAGLWNSLGL